MFKKIRKLIFTCLAIVIVIGLAGGALFYYINFGPIKAKEPVSIKDSIVVKDYTDVNLIGHRGFSCIAPENTTAAFEKAIELGLYGCEFDIQLTSDGEWVVMHDPNIKKMTGTFGYISEMTAGELTGKVFTNGANIDSYPSLFMPTLEETLKLLYNHNIVPFIEIKTKTADKIEEMYELLDSYGLTRKAWIISFEKDPLVKLRELDEDIKISYLVHEVTPEAINFCQMYKLNGIDFNKKKAGANEVRLIIDAELVPQVWTVDTIEDFENFYSYGVRYFTGNCLTY